jgi:hypothetical protein
MFPSVMWPQVSVFFQKNSVSGGSSYVSFSDVTPCFSSSFSPKNSASRGSSYVSFSDVTPCFSFWFFFFNSVSGGSSYVSFSDVTPCFSSIFSPKKFSFKGQLLCFLQWCDPMFQFLFFFFFFSKKFSFGGQLLLQWCDPNVSVSNKKKISFKSQLLVCFRDVTPHVSVYIFPTIPLQGAAVLPLSVMWRWR